MEETRKIHQAEEKPKDLEEGLMGHESENPEILVTRNKDSLLTLLHRPAREEGEAAGVPEFNGEHGSGFVNEGVRVEDMDSMQKATEVHSSLALQHCIVEGKEMQSCRVLHGNRKQTLAGAWLSAMDVMPCKTQQEKKVLTKSSD